MRLKQAGMALAIASALGLGAVEQGSAQVFSQGGPIFVKFLDYEAALRSELWFFGATNPGPDQTPAGGTYLFPNKNPQLSTANAGKAGTAPLGSPTGNLNQVAYGGPFAAGTELHFGLFVQDLFQPGHVNPADSTTRGAWFYTGAGTENFDGRIHAVVTPLSSWKYRVGFEDLCRTNRLPENDPLCYNTRFSADFDFDDHVFEVTATPEPVSMALMGTGLAGLAGAARRRRRKQNEEEQQ